jgi:hypothetical protein
MTPAFERVKTVLVLEGAANAVVTFLTLLRVNCYITVLQQCSCTFTFYTAYLIIMKLSHVSAVTVFELIIYSSQFETDKEYKCRFRICGCLLWTHSSIQSDYTYCITSVYRSQTVSIIMRLAVAASMEVAES